MGGLSANIAGLFGVDENAITLLLCILSAYPVSLLYVVFLRASNYCSQVLRSVYFLFCGLLTLTFAYGANSLHYLATCVVCYLTLKCLPRSAALLINSLFTFTYLLYGYYLTQIDASYTITWTMPQCVLTLRLIALSFDLYDGEAAKGPDGEKKKDMGRHTEWAIASLPPLHLFLSYCYFPGTLLVGPLVPYRSYWHFISNSGSGGSKSSGNLVGTFHGKAVSLSVLRLLGGLTCLGLYFYGSLHWPPEYLQSAAFTTGRLWWKLTAMAIVAKVYMYKYIAVWMTTEAACMLAGVTGASATGLGPGLNLYQHTNVNLTQFEFAHSCTDIISSYNMTTNGFAFRYVYRRLKFLGNIHLSKLLTLLFLSVWHGFASGYHFAFSTEFLLLYFEKSFGGVFQAAQQRCSVLNSDLLKPVFWLVGRLYTYLFIGYAFVAFMFLHADVWWPILAEVHFAGHLFLGGYIALAVAAKLAKRCFY